MTQTLKPCPFCGSDARMWPSHTKADKNGSYEIVGCSNVDCFIEPTTDEYLPYEEAVQRWNTRPAPAATDTGLETKAYVWKTKDAPWRFEEPFFRSVDQWRASDEHYDHADLCLCSQADELLAAERAEKEAWRKAAIEHQKRAKGLEADASRWHQKAMDAGVIVHSDGTTSHPMRKERDDLKADNAAQAARIKAETELREDHQQRNKELEAKLAAANEVAQLVIQAEEDKSGDPNFYILMMQTAYDKARAVLGGKPSC